jgi:DNA-binding response OmpR family regulator
MKVMLVEDDFTMRSLLKTLLQLEGFQVVADFEINPQAIVHKMIDEKPDVTLMDVHLRNANGIDIIRSIRQHPELIQLKILMSSGEDVREACTKAGADGFLLKPYMPDDLIGWIRAHSS